MAVVHVQQLSADEILGIWKITETEEELMGRLSANPWIDNMLEGVTHPQKRLEYLASRLLTGQLANLMKLPFKGIHKDEHGKPHPIGRANSRGYSESKFFLSISHSYPYAAGCIHRAKPVGIDIETPKEKIFRVAHKFLKQSEMELAGASIERLCLMWAAKEAMYKMQGKNGISFKADMTVDDILNTKNQVLARALINGNIEQILIGFFSFEGNIIAFTR